MTTIQNYHQMNYMETTLQKAHEKMELQKMELLKSQLMDMGRNDAVSGITHQERFPKICAVKEGNWMVFYVDNGTKNGEFVIAFSDYKISYEGLEVKITCNHVTNKNLMK